VLLTGAVAGHRPSGAELTRVRQRLQLSVAAAIVPCGQRQRWCACLANGAGSALISDALLTEQESFLSKLDRNNSLTCGAGHPPRLPHNNSIHVGIDRTENLYHPAA
jgi:hypothetical protein